MLKLDRYRSGFFASVAGAAFALSTSVSPADITDIQNMPDIPSLLITTMEPSARTNALNVILDAQFEALERKYPDNPNGYYYKQLNQFISAIQESIACGHTEQAEILDNILLATNKEDFNIEHGGFSNTALNDQTLLINTVMLISGARHIDKPEFRDMARDVITTLFDTLTTSPAPLNLNSLADSTLNTVLKMQDPHSRYLNFEATQNKNDRFNGIAFSGIGTEVAYDTELPEGAEDNRRIATGLLIKKLIGDNVPAALAGIMPNDLITHVDGTPLSGLILDEARNLIMGETGSTVRLDIIRNDPALNASSLVIEVVRGPIPTDPVTPILRESGVAHIPIRSYNGQTDTYLDRALQLMEDQNATGYALDLRNNSGGLFQQAAFVVDNFISGDPELAEYFERRESILDTLKLDILNSRPEFINYPFPELTTRVEALLTAEEIEAAEAGMPEPTAEEQALVDRNIIASMRTNTGKDPHFYLSPGAETDKPMVIIMNGNSASSSEVTAGALQSHGRAIVIGTPTYGKGSGQSYVNIDSNKDGIIEGQLGITSFLHYDGPGEGINIQGIGITPDIIMSGLFNNVAINPPYESTLPHTLGTPDDHNYLHQSQFECRPKFSILQEGIAVDAFNNANVEDPELHCADAYLTGSSEFVEIVPLIQSDNSDTPHMRMSELEPN